MDRKYTDNVTSEIGIISGTYIHKRGNQQHTKLSVIAEHELTVHLFDETSIHFTCISQHLQELIIGHLFSEGCISELSDLIKCSFNIERTYAEACFNTRSECCIPLLPLDSFNINLSFVFDAAQKLYQGFDNYKATRSTHSCQLWENGNFIHTFEDIGRHNTIDKVIGYALLNGTRLHKYVGS